MMKQYGTHDGLKHSRLALLLYPSAIMADRSGLVHASQTWQLLPSHIVDFVCSSPCGYQGFGPWCY